MTLEEKQRKLEELRQDYKNAKSEVDRKIIEIQGKLLLKAIKKG